MRNILVLFGFVVFLLWGAAAITGAEEMQTQGPDGKEVQKEVRVVSLEECIDIALQNNHTRPVSRFAVEIAQRPSTSRPCHPTGHRSLRRRPIP